MAVDPKKITNYNLNVNQLEEHILFWCLAAGKNGVVSAKCLELFLNKIMLDWEESPFLSIKRFGFEKLAETMRKCGIGSYNIKSKGIWKLVNSNIDLKNCTADELDEIPCIGPKTARCFIIHSREGARYAGLDRHVLRYLKDLGYNTPESTPNNIKIYKKFEEIFLKKADELGMSPADLDLKIWNEYRSK